MMAKLTLAVIGASNLLAAFGAGFYMVTVDELTVLPSLLVGAGVAGGLLAGCMIESLDEGMAAAGDTRGDGVNRPPNKCHIAHDGKALSR
jgi:hypothetical protein